MGVWMHDYSGAGVQGCGGAGVHGCMDAGVQGAGVHGFTGAGKQGCLAAWVQGCQGAPPSPLPFYPSSVPPEQLLQCTLVWHSIMACHLFCAHVVTGHCSAQMRDFVGQG